ncbi:hypothetical protein AYI70_g306 [Smittium culicis]|uniref:PH domain-containing protein n=1 Tax=Smittium culicis TaxID=133412 RepID=A0A1R1YHJ0_9FUNG|nr:hypothetical protein AYI70_g306 [Smittium culicis]
MFSRKKSKSKKNSSKSSDSSSISQPDTSDSTSRQKSKVWSKLVTPFDKNSKPKIPSDTSQSSFPRPQSPNKNTITPLSPSSNINSPPPQIYPTSPASQFHNLTLSSHVSEIKQSSSVQDLWFDYIISGDLQKVSYLLNDVPHILSAKKYSPTSYHEALVAIASDALGPDTSQMDGLQVSIIVYKNSHADWRLNRGVSVSGELLSPQQMHEAVLIREQILEIILNAIQPVHLNGNFFGNFKNTTLHLASFFNDINLVSRLLAQGANPVVENSLGFLPEMITTDSSVRTLLVQHQHFLSYEQSYKSAISNPFDLDNASSAFADTESSNSNLSDPGNLIDFDNNQAQFHNSSTSSDNKNPFAKRLSTILEESEDDLSFSNHEYNNPQVSTNMSLLFSASVATFEGVPIHENQSTTPRTIKIHSSYSSNSSSDDSFVSNIKIDSQLSFDPVKSPISSDSNSDYDSANSTSQKNTILSPINSNTKTIPDNNSTTTPGIDKLDNLNTPPNQKSTSSINMPTTTAIRSNPQNKDSQTREFENVPDISKNDKSVNSNDPSISPKPKPKNKTIFSELDFSSTQWNNKSIRISIDPNTVGDMDLDQIFSNSTESLNKLESNLKNSTFSSQNSSRIIQPSQQQKNSLFSNSKSSSKILSSSNSIPIESESSKLQTNLSADNPPKSSVTPQADILNTNQSTFGPYHEHADISSSPENLPKRNSMSDFETHPTTTLDPTNNIQSLNQQTDQEICNIEKNPESTSNNIINSDSNPLNPQLYTKDSEYPLDNPELSTVSNNLSIHEASTDSRDSIRPGISITHQKSLESAVKESLHDNSSLIPDSTYTTSSSSKKPIISINKSKLPVDLIKPKISIVSSTNSYDTPEQFDITTKIDKKLDPQNLDQSKTLIFPPASSQASVEQAALVNTPDSKSIDNYSDLSETANIQTSDSITDANSKIVSPTNYQKKNTYFSPKLYDVIMGSKNIPNPISNTSSSAKKSTPTKSSTFANLAIANYFSVSPSKKSIGTLPNSSLDSKPDHKSNPSSSPKSYPNRRFTTDSVPIDSFLRSETHNLSQNFANKSVSNLTTNEGETISLDDQNSSPESNESKKSKNSQNIRELPTDPKLENTTSLRPVEFSSDQPEAYTSENRLVNTLPPKISSQFQDLDIIYGSQFDTTTSDALNSSRSSNKSLLNSSPQVIVNEELVSISSGSGSEVELSSHGSNLSRRRLSQKKKKSIDRRKTEEIFRTELYIKSQQSLHRKQRLIQQEHIEKFGSGFLDNEDSEDSDSFFSQLSRLDSKISFSSARSVSQPKKSSDSSNAQNTPKKSGLSTSSPRTSLKKSKNSARHKSFSSIPTRPISTDSQSKNFPLKVSLPGRHSLGLSVIDNDSSPLDLPTKLLESSFSGGSFYSAQFRSASSGSHFDNLRKLSFSNSSKYNSSILNSQYSNLNQTSSDLNIKINNSANNIQIANESSRPVSRASFSNNNSSMILSNTQKLSSTEALTKLLKPRNSSSNGLSYDLGPLLPHGVPKKPRKSSKTDIEKSKLVNITENSSKVLPVTTDSTNPQSSGQPTPHDASSAENKVISSNLTSIQNLDQNSENKQSSLRDLKFNDEDMEEALSKSLRALELSKNQKYKVIDLFNKSENIIDNSASAFNKSSDSLKSDFNTSSPVLNPGIIKNSIEKISITNKKALKDRRESDILTKIRGSGIVKGRAQMFDNLSDPVISNDSSYITTTGNELSDFKQSNKSSNDNKSLLFSSGSNSSFLSKKKSDGNNNSSKLSTSKHIQSPYSKSSLSVLSKQAITDDSKNIIPTNAKTSDRSPHSDQNYSNTNSENTPNVLYPSRPGIPSKFVDTESDNNSILMHQGRDYTSEDSRAILSSGKSNNSKSIINIDSGLSDSSYIKSFPSLSKSSNLSTVINGNFIPGYDSSSISSQPGDLFYKNTSSSDTNTFGKSVYDNFRDISLNSKISKEFDSIPAGIVAKRKIMQSSSTSPIKGTINDFKSNSKSNVNDNSNVFQKNADLYNIPQKLFTGYKDIKINQVLQTSDKLLNLSNKAHNAQISNNNSKSISTLYLVPLSKISSDKTNSNKSSLQQNNSNSANEYSSQELHNKTGTNNSITSDNGSIYLSTNDTGNFDNYQDSDNQNSVFNNHSEKNTNDKNRSDELIEMASDLVNNDSLIIHGSESIFSSIEFDNPSNYSGSNKSIFSKKSTSNPRFKKVNNLSSNSLNEFLHKSGSLENPYQDNTSSNIISENYKSPSISHTSINNSNLDYSLTEKLNELYLSYAASKALLIGKENLFYDMINPEGNKLQHSPSPTSSNHNIIFPSNIGLSAIDEKFDTYVPLNNPAIISFPVKKISNNFIYEKPKNKGAKFGDYKNNFTIESNLKNTVNNTRMNFFDEVDKAIKLKLQNSSGLVAIKASPSASSSLNSIEYNSKPDLNDKNGALNSLSSSRHSPSSLPWFITPLNGSTINNFFSLPKPRLMPGYLYLKILSIEDLIDLNSHSYLANNNLSGKTIFGYKIVLVVRNGIDTKASSPIAINSSGKMQVNQEFIVLIDPSKPITIWLRIQAITSNPINKRSSHQDRNVTSFNNKRFSLFNNNFFKSGFSNKKAKQPAQNIPLNAPIKKKNKFLQKLAKFDNLCLPLFSNNFCQNTRSSKLGTSGIKRKPVKSVFKGISNLDYFDNIKSPKNVNESLSRRHSAPPDALFKQSGVKSFEGKNSSDSNSYYKRDSAITETSSSQHINDRISGNVNKNSSDNYKSFDLDPPLSPQILVSEERGYSSDVGFDSINKTIRSIKESIKRYKSKPKSSKKVFKLSGSTIFTPKELIKQEKKISVVYDREKSILLNHIREEDYSGNTYISSSSDDEDAESDNYLDLKTETIGCAAIHVGDMIDEVYLKTLIDSWDVVSVWDPLMVCRLQLQLFYIPISLSTKILSCDDITKINLNSINYPIITNGLPKSINYCQMGIGAIEWHNRTWSTGFLSQLGGDCLFWRRRFYRLIGGFLVIYKMDNNRSSRCVIDLSAATEIIDLHNTKEMANSKFAESNKYQSFEIKRPNLLSPKAKETKIKPQDANKFEPKLTPKKNLKLKPNPSSNSSSELLNTSYSLQNTTPSSSNKISNGYSKEVSPNLVKIKPLRPKKSTEIIEHISDPSINENIKFSFRIVFGVHGAIDFYADNEQELNKWLIALKGMINKIPKIPLWLVRLIHEDVSLQLCNE